MSGFRWMSGCLLAGFLFGCGGSGTTRVEHSVTGKVTFQGEPVTEGTVQFEDAASGQGGSAPLSASGTYTASLSDGTYKVIVLPPTEVTPDTENSPGGIVVKDAKNIPQKYRALETTPLSAPVSAALVTHDFELMP